MNNNYNKMLMPSNSITILPTNSVVTTITRPAIPSANTATITTTTTTDHASKDTIILYRCFYYDKNDYYVPWSSVRSLIPMNAAIFRTLDAKSSFKSSNFRKRIFGSLRCSHLNQPVIQELE